MELWFDTSVAEERNYENELPEHSGPEKGESNTLYANDSESYQTLMNGYIWID